MKCDNCGNTKRFSLCCGLKVSSKAWTGIAKKITVKDSLIQMQTAIQQGNLSLAERINKSLLERCENNNQLTYLNGLIQWQRGNVAQAYTLIKLAYDRQYSGREVKTNLAKLSSLVGKHRRALTLINGVVDTSPDQIDLICMAFDIAQAASDIRAGARFAKLLVACAPNDKQHWLNLIAQTDALGDLSASLEASLEASKIFPDHSEFFFITSSLYERLHNTDASSTALRQGYALSPEDVFGKIVESKLYRRVNQFSEAIKILENIDAEECSQQLKVLYYAERVLNHRALSQSSLALCYANKMHSGISEDRYQKELASVTEYLTDVERFQCDELNQLSHTQTDLAPLFIVGFPRCGSTLLEKLIFEKFQCIQTDECTAFEHVEKHFHEEFSCPWWQTKNSSLTDVFVQSLYMRLSSSYYSTQEIETFEPTVPQPLIDKNLTNLTRLPLVSACFPNAPIIRLIRHPLDTVISCYLSKFSHSHLWQKDLLSVAEHFIRQQQHWASVRAKVTNPVLELVYEKVAMHSGLTNSVDHFLEEHWQTKPRARGSDRNVSFQTRTASYSQVENPVNQGSIRFSDEYIEHIPKDVITVLQPYITEWQTYMENKG